MKGAFGLFALSLVFWGTACVQSGEAQMQDQLDARGHLELDLAKDFDGTVLTPESAMEGCLYQAMLGQGSEEGCIGIMVEYCPENAGTTVDMLGCIEPEIGFWEEKLDSVYRDLIAVYEDQDTEFDEIRALAPRLENLQSAWIAWRDVACGFEYDKFRGGTLGRLTGASCRMEMTAMRAIELQDLLAEARM